MSFSAMVIAVVQAMVATPHSLPAALACHSCATSATLDQRLAKLLRKTKLSLSFLWRPPSGGRFYVYF